MTFNEKQNLITEVVALLQSKIKVAPGRDEQSDKSYATQQTVEMLTIKEGAILVKGLSEHTVRQLALQGKIPSIRTGAGRNGKMLISKSALLNYFADGSV